ncbi:MAG TPA: DUF2339 domain-containing protein, partial [Candidatus Hydrogenedentes bacterium]|nr:DUF2339 domain-containing protein [Candidatus Hydrogenedentota bacterium]
VVLGQALLVFGLFQTWRRRVDKRDPMSECLLVIAMALVTIAVPIELKLYAIPIAWALEGVVFVYIGLRFNRLLVRAAGVIGLGLAACGLLWRLPMHTERFIVVFNVPFGSWAAVIAAATCAAYLLTRAEDDTSRPILVGLAGLLAFALGSLLLSLESFEFWTEYRPGYYRVHLMSSLVVLWALIPGITATVLAHKKLAAWAPLALVCYAIGGAMFFGGFVYYDSPSTWFALNAVFPLRLLFVIALWWGGMLMRRCGPEHSGDVLTVTGHALLTILLAVEIHRWGNYCTWLSDRMAVSFISAAWGIQAFVLLWVGLATRNRARRVVGFALFGLTVAKVCFYDLGSLERVYQIVSFLASGLLLLLGCYFYHRYSPMLLGEEKKEGIEQT